MGEGGPGGAKGRGGHMPPKAMRWLITGSPNLPLPSLYP